MNLRLLPYIGDIIAIPLFLFVSLYYYNLSKKKKLSIEEQIIYFFGVSGFICDIIFVFILRA